MENYCPNAPQFNALLSGAAVLQRTMARYGYNHQGFRLLVPLALGQAIEHELLTTDPESWLPFTDGIQVHAEGSLKQLIVAESIWIGWKTGKYRKRKRILAHV